MGHLCFTPHKHLEDHLEIRAMGFSPNNMRYDVVHLHPPLPFSKENVTFVLADKIFLPHCIKDEVFVMLHKTVGISLGMVADADKDTCEQDLLQKIKWQTWFTPEVVIINLTNKEAVGICLVTGLIVLQAYYYYYNIWVN